MKRALVFGLLGATSLALADVVQFVNGDRYTGTVLAVNENEVRLTNDVTGALTVPRAKVVSIHFGTNPKLTETPAAQPAQSAFKVDPGAVEQVQREFLGTASPEANQMFQEMVQGLASGKLNVGDIRKTAIETINEVRELQKDLGDDDTAGLLDSYVSILESFVKNTSTNAPPGKPGK